ncbi:hypothetical protein D3Y55_21130 [Mesorhizobium sp. DCY119]|nr:hypothetical protein D3Y55_21130 [Mesorhizobium sp. DCY119]
MLTLAGMLVGGYLLKGPQEAESASAPVNARPVAQETYRLVHAIGNAEKVSAKRLSKGECEGRKKDMAIVAVALRSGGSVTCLPDSLFSD